jgi:hypothetical protein
MKRWDIKPYNTYNMDEKGFSMGVALRCKVICRRSRRTPKLTQDGSREWVTVIETVSGDGRILRPMIINKGAAHYMGWYANLTKKDLATFGYSHKGWSNEYLGLKWLKENFDRETKKV